MFNLDQAISEWRRQMAAGGIKSAPVLDELEAHLREDVERQVRAGVNEESAFNAAVQKMGKSDLLKAEFAKIRRFKDVPVGKVVGAGCCVAAALYSLVLAPPLVTVPELGFGQRFLGVAALLLTLLSLISLRFSHRYLPVIRSRRTRIASVSACALAGFIWLWAFSNLLPNVIVPRLMNRTASVTRSAAPIASGFGPARVPLLVRNQISSAGDPRFAQSGFVNPTLMPVVFDIGISLFWAMTLGAVLGGLAYGLEEAARRRSTETVYV